MLWLLLGILLGWFIGENEAEKQSINNSDVRKAASEGARTSVSAPDMPDRDAVACYIKANGALPDFYITKEKARAAGWRGGQAELELLFPGKAIAASHGYWGRTRELLPKDNYFECDIGTIGQRKRGAKRLVFTEGCVSSGSYYGYSDSCRIYYTEDHYDTFVELDLSKCPVNQQPSTWSTLRALDRIR